jgi:hypothetical protein
MMKCGNADAADTIFVAQIRRHLRKQRFGNFHCGAPAQTFVGRNGAEPAIVGLVAQGTLAGSQRSLRSGGIHFDGFFNSIPAC